jgi:hypothetical protein
MQKMCFRLSSFCLFVALIVLSHLMTGCNDQSKQSGAEHPAGGQTKAQSEAKRNYGNAYDQRTKAQNIKTH